MAEQDIAAAKSDYKQSRGGLLPQVDLIGTTGPVSDARFPIVLTDKNGVGHIFSQDDTWKVGIFRRLDFTLTQPLYTFGKIDNRKDAASLGVEARTAAREAQRNKIVLNVKELYYAYLIAHQGKNAARDADAYINDASRRIKRLLELKAKNVDPSDLYRMEAFSAEVKGLCGQGRIRLPNRLCCSENSGRTARK